MSAVPAAERIGVVVMAYGTPATPDDVEPYYTHIRRGRPPTPEQLANLQMRYDALGGTSTLAARTADQVAAITEALERLHPGRFLTALGQKHAFPFVEDGVAFLAKHGVRSIIGVVLAPHFSGFSVGEYQIRVAAAAAQAGLPATGIDRWHDLPEYRSFLAGAVAAGLRGLPPRTEVVFTAHSLPERVLADDPYPDELRASAEAVADLVKIRDSDRAHVTQMEGVFKQKLTAPKRLAVPTALPAPKFTPALSAQLDQQRQSHMAVLQAG